jgi:hypothetical protein
MIKIYRIAGSRRSSSIADFGLRNGDWGLRNFLRGSATNFGALHFLMPLNSNPAELATELTEAPEEANLELRILDCGVRNFTNQGFLWKQGHLRSEWRNQSTCSAQACLRRWRERLIAGPIIGRPPCPHPVYFVNPVILSKFSERRVRRPRPTFAPSLEGKPN